MRVRTLHVVTHPEATHHLDGLVGGWFDSALTPTGERDAERIGAALRSRLPEGAAVELRTSDLRRARQTAAAIERRLGVRATTDAGLREMSYGAADGRPQAWLDQRFVHPPAEGERLRHDQGVPGAETRWQLAERVYAAMQRIERLDVACQVLVTHGFAATFVVAAWIGMRLADVGQVSFVVPSGSITELRQDDLFHNRAVVSLGDTRHLGGSS